MIDTCWEMARREEGLYGVDQICLDNIPIIQKKITG